MKDQIITLSERLKNEDEVIRKAMDQFSKRMRVSIPGIITEFNSSKQTVKVRPAITENVILKGVIYKGVELPQLEDVPVVMPRAGGYVLTLPIKAGDECLVVFGDMCIDAWWKSGGVQNQIYRRRHDLSDGFAILGPWSQPNVIYDYADDCVQLRDEDGNVIIELKDTSINIKAKVTVTISSEMVNITGSNVSIGDSTIIDDKPFLTHTHSGVMSGGAVTGPVV